MESIHSTTFRYVVTTYYCKICAHERSLEGLQFFLIFHKLYNFKCVSFFHERFPFPANERDYYSVLGTSYLIQMYLILLHSFLSMNEPLPFHHMNGIIGTPQLN